MKEEKRDTKKIGIFIAVILVISAFGALTPMASAACNNGSVNVAFVPDPDGPGGGELATTDSAFSGFSFTDVPYASVNATTLANYDQYLRILFGDNSKRTDFNRF